MGENKKIVMTIAGSDPSGGAGIQADLKIFSALGLHGISVITCVTAQNTQKVESIHQIPVEIIEKQIDLLLKDMKPVVVKTGMLYDKKIVKSSVLTGGRADVKQTDEGIKISIPKEHQQDIDTIVVLKLNGPADDIAPVDVEE